MPPTAKLSLSAASEDLQQPYSDCAPVFTYEACITAAATATADGKVGAAAGQQPATAGSGAVVASQKYAGGSDNDADVTAAGKA